jgi:hypothetical protein
MGQTTSRQQIKLQSKQRMPTFGHEMKSLIDQGHKSLALMLSTRLCTKNGDNFGSYTQWICFAVFRFAVFRFAVFRFVGVDAVLSSWRSALPGRPGSRSLFLSRQEK